MTTPSKADVLRIAGEPVAWLWETAAETGIQRARPHPNLGVAVVPLYTETKLLAMYAAGAESAKSEGWRQCAVGQHTSQFCAMAEKARVEGAEGMRERVVVSANKEVSDWEVLRDISVARKESSIIESTNILAINRLIEAIRALPITPTNTEGEQDERKDYCGSCGEWTGGPLICCHESQSAGHKPNVTKTEAITVRQTRKESREMMQSHEHEYRRLESIIDAANERIRELTDAFEDAENRIIELREVSDKLEKALKDTLSHLVAATSLLSRSPKTAAPSNKMFDQMVVDYKAAAKRSRAAFAEVAALREKDRE